MSFHFDLPPDINVSILPEKYDKEIVGYILDKYLRKVECADFHNIKTAPMSSDFSVSHRGFFYLWIFCFFAFSLFQNAYNDIGVLGALPQTKRICIYKSSAC